MSRVLKSTERSAAGCCTAFLDLGTDSFDHIIKNHREETGQIAELTELRVEHVKVGSSEADAWNPRPAPVERTLAKALDILEAVANTGRLSVVEIANMDGLNRTTTHRLVHALTRAGYLQLAENGRGYDIGLKVLPMAARQLDSNRVRLTGLPCLNKLAQQAGERVNLGILFVGEHFYLAGIEKPSFPNMFSRFGKPAPLRCCSLGKAIIAFMPEDEQRTIIAQRPFVHYTANTIVDPGVLMAELAEVRRRDVRPTIGSMPIMSGAWRHRFRMPTAGRSPVGRGHWRQRWRSRQDLRFGRQGRADGRDHLARPIAMAGTKLSPSRGSG